MAAEHVGETQTSRRVKYGVNVAIAAAAAALLVIIVNILAYKRLINVRWDLTATRAWSLSEQTRRVVGNLKDDYRLVMLLSTTNEYGEQAKGVISEYGYISPRLTMEQIDPTNEGRMVKFYGELLERFDSEVGPMKEAVEAGKSALAKTRQDLEPQMALIRETLEDPQLQDAGLKQFIAQVSGAFAEIGSQGEELDGKVKEQLESPLPDFASAINILKKTLTNYDEDIFRVVVEKFKLSAESPAAPPSVKDRLLRVVKMIEATRESLKEPIAKISTIATDNEYAKLRNQVGPETVVVLGPPSKPPLVIKLEEMFKQPDPRELEQLEPGEIPERRFLGEEKITGALAAMQLNEPPLIVFVSGGQRPALGFNGDYQSVAARLQNMNFDVQEWSAAGRPGPMGQPMPPGPPPEPKPGQKVVWIITPVEPPNPMQQMPGGGAGQKIAEHISARLEMGDSAWVSVSVSPMNFGMGDPITQMIQPYGVTAQTDRLILAETPGRGGRMSAVSNHPIERWPDGMAITKAVSGMMSIVVQGSPLVIKEGESEGLKTWKLVEVAGPGLWAETDLQSQSPKLKKETAADSFVVGAAVEKGTQRLIVLADPMWATDQVTTYGKLGPGTAHLFGAMFPGNAELFVNGVFWLANVDELIAAGARSQDIRRVETMSPMGMLGLRWGMAALMVIAPLGAGIAVWLVRRGG